MALPLWLALAAPLPARAHLLQSGLGGYYDGLAHLLVTPADLLLVLALVVLAGQNGALAARTLLLTLPLAWLLGGGIGLRLSDEPTLPWLTTLTFTLAGALVALEARPAPPVLVALAAVTGGLHGLVNGAAMNHSSGGSLALLGAVSGVAVLVTVVPGELTRLRAAWMRIALRVVGSWIAAAGLLMLGWLAHGPR